MFFPINIGYDEGVERDGPANQVVMPWIFGQEEELSHEANDTHSNQAEDHESALNYGFYEFWCLLASRSVYLTFKLLKFEEIDEDVYFD